MIDYGTMDWNTSDDIDEFRRSVARFCSRIAELSAANEPPGANAANGYFRDRVLDDPDLTSVIPPRGKADDPEAEKIFQILATFEQGIRGAFAPENYESSWTKSGRLALEALDKLKTEIGAVFTAIAAASTINITALAAVAKSVDDLIAKINNSGIKYEGKHANGWIQKGVKSAAETASGSLAPYTTNSIDPFVKKFAIALKGITDQIVAIPDFKNDPWLYGQWQILFQAIMAAGGTALAALRPDPLPVKAPALAPARAPVAAPVAP